MRTLISAPALAFLVTLALVEQAPVSEARAGIRAMPAAKLGAATREQALVLALQRKLIEGASS